jgi:hypothetical protein
MTKTEFEQLEIQITQVCNGYLATIPYPNGDMKSSTAFGATEVAAVAALELKVCK